LEHTHSDFTEGAGHRATCCYDVDIAAVNPSNSVVVVGGGGLCGGRIDIIF
jgi:hypothetical protein